MASCFQKIPSGNESRAVKEKMMKWVFQTIATDRDWIRLGFLKVVFSGWGQFVPRFILQEELI